jgi:hypothetical protein
MGDLKKNRPVSPEEVRDVFTGRNKLRALGLTPRPKPEPAPVRTAPYTLAELADWRERLAAAEAFDGHGNNPNKGRAWERECRLMVSLIVGDLQQRGLLPKE